MMRYVYCALPEAPFYAIKRVTFDGVSGFAKSRVQENVKRLHDIAKRSFKLNDVLEVSSASPDALGVSLSAFNLKNAQGDTVEALFQITNMPNWKLIDPKEIRFVLAPIAPVLSGGLVHYERVAFQQEVDQIRRIEAEPARTGIWIISSKEQTGCLIPVECRCDGMPHPSRVQVQQMRTADRPGLQQAIQILPELRSGHER